MAATLMPWPRAKFFTPGTNTPLAGGKVWTYLAGTLTPQVTQVSPAGANNTNPVILDANGEADIWLVDGIAYKINVLDASNNQIPGYPIDNVYSAEHSGTGAAIRADLINSADAAKGDALIAVKQPFAGAVATNQHNKNLESISVKDFGAVGDGVTDDYPAFLAASNASDNILVPRATSSYKLDSSIAAYTQRWEFHSGAYTTGTGTLGGPKVYDGIATTWLNTANSGVFSYLTTAAAKSAEVAPSAGIGFTGFSRSSGSTASNIHIGLAAHGYNDHTTIANGLWGLYSTVVREALVTGTTLGLEIDVANMGVTVPVYPAFMFPAGLTAASWICSGGEMTTLAPQVRIASVAIGIISNDPANNARFDKGIVFHNKSLDGCDGATGTAVAIAMASGHQQLWYNNSNQVVGEILCSTQTVTNAQRLLLGEGGFDVVDRAGGSFVFRAKVVPNAVNGLVVQGSIAAAGIVDLFPAGGDANIDLALTPKGTGDIRFGTYTAGAVAQAGYITIKDIGGTVRRLLVG